MTVDQIALQIFMQAMLYCYPLQYEDKELYRECIKNIRLCMAYKKKEEFSICIDEERNRLSIKGVIL